MDETSYKKAYKNLVDCNKVRNAFKETTAITFESIYAEYINNIAGFNISKNSVVKRYNDCLLHAEICYDNLSIAKIKMENGIIKTEDLETLMRENHESPNKMKQRITRILKHKGKIERHKCYALAGLFAPTLVEQYNQHGVNVLKKYIESIKNNSVDGIFDSIQISQNEEGYDKLFANMKKRIMQFSNFNNRKNEELEK